MAKRKNKFTDREIQSFKARDKDYLETEPSSGLYVRIWPSGKKTFMTVYSFEGKQRWLKIGTYPNMALTDAREKVREISKQVEANIDPSLAKQREKAEQIKAPTVADFVEEYLTKWAELKKKSAKEDRRILEKDIIPVWGKRKLKDITRREIVNLIDNVALRGPIMGNRTLAVIRKMFNFALKRGAIEFSPCQNLTPPGKENKKDRFLSDDEIKALWPKMDEHLTDQTNRAIKIILVTAQRPNEVATMHWNDIDGEWWTVPATKTKNGKEHRVFLSKIAFELLGEPQKTGFVFPSCRRLKSESSAVAKANRPPINPNAFSTAIREKMKYFEGVEHFTPHDLRRTAATHIAKLGYGSIVGKILNHTDQTVTAIYDRYSYDKEKQTALSEWGRTLENHIRTQKQETLGDK